MSPLVELSAQEVIHAFVAGGFRVSRRERGLVVLLRARDAIALRDEGTLERAEILALLERVHVAEATFLGWLSRRTDRRESGFRPMIRVGRSSGAGRELTLDEVLTHASELHGRVEAVHQETQAARRAADDVAKRRAPVTPPDEERLRALRRHLDLWDEGVRELRADARKK